jgi:hypothetical protein
MTDPQTAGEAGVSPDDRLAARAGTLAAAVRHSLYSSLPYVCLVGLYVGLGALGLRAIDHQMPFTLTGIYRLPVLLTGLYLGVMLLVAIARDVILARRRPRDLDTWRSLYRRHLGTRRVLEVLIVLVTLPALLYVMVGFRQALTEIMPFTYDPAFMGWDHWLHFGRHPWELLHPLLGRPVVTVIIDRAYVYGWFTLMWVGTIWQTVHGREPVRLQFFLSFSATWILLGTISAIALSSAGPVYFGRVTGLPDPYAPLMAYLAAVDAETPLWALANQERLWLTYRTWGGITAMPSMHLAITTVVALTAVRTHSRLVVVVGPLWLAMLVGSIHLGWHYAIDSYAGILAAGAIWYGCGRFARWWLGRGARVEDLAHVH